MSYTEFPTDRIVDVHFKSHIGPPPPNPFGEPYCGSYGYGAVIETVGFVVSAVSTGPNIFPPFIGTFSLITANGPNGIYGGLNHPYRGAPTTMTAAPYGLIASSLALNATSLDFTDQQLMSLSDLPFVPVGGFGWTVPMVKGGVLIDPSHPEFGYIQLVIDTYDIEWKADPAIGAFEFGLGISHPLSNPPPGNIFSAPPEPQVIGGSGSYTYDFQWKLWIDDLLPPITTANQYDATIGGPALLWWMQRRTGAPNWDTTNTQFGGFANGVIGDSYTWEIRATCMPEPSLFGR
jgi:hypothetical protein